MHSKLIHCKSCGAEIAKSAKLCPSCGAKNKKHTVLGVILTVIGVMILISVIGSMMSDTPKVVDPSDPSQLEDSQSGTTKPSDTETKPEKTTFSVGEKVELSDIVVTLVNVSESSGANYMNPSDGNVFVLCEFEIENNSSKDIAVSSLVSFETYVDGYSKQMSLTATLSSDKSQLDGTIAAGKKMNGVIGYESASDWSEIEVRFTPDFWSGKDITFVASK